MVAAKALSLAALALALLWQWRGGGRHVPRSTDPLVADAGDRFQAFLADRTGRGTFPARDGDGDGPALAVRGRGVLNWDRDTFFWRRFADNFGSNPHSAYMYSLLPLGGLLPSPMWRLRRGDAVVLLFRRPPPADYFSFTTFCLGSYRRGLVFASLGDALNSHAPALAGTTHQLFAHVVVARRSRDTLDRVRAALVGSGVAAGAIHVAVVPDSVAEEDAFAFYEVVLRLFRFHNRTEGDAYLRSQQPVFYLSPTRPATAEEEAPPLAAPAYRERDHPDSVHEPSRHGAELEAFRRGLLARLNQTFEAPAIQPPIDFGPLHIVGLRCLEHVGHGCLGDCPDAAYFGSNIVDTSNDVAALTLLRDDEFHLITMLDHRRSRAAVYSSVALLTTRRAVLDKTALDVRGTPVGVLSNDFDGNATDPFFSWLVTRNPDHCRRTRHFVRSCTVLDGREVARGAHFAYCERLYLNPVTGTGPDWDAVLPARAYHVRDVRPRRADALEYKRKNADLYRRLRLPSSNVTLAVFRGEERLKFLHIIKTGGEALERYAWRSKGGPHLDYAHCRRAAAADLHRSRAAPAACRAAAGAIGVLLCGLNCECCAGDLRAPGGFHGTLLRAPRAHVLSLFSHGHAAHHPTWRRAAADPPLYAAEGALRAAEALCGHAGTDGAADWRAALGDVLRASLAARPPGAAGAAGEGVQVIPLRNAMSHALTCGKASGGTGQHFRVLPSPDALEPRLDAALATLHRLEWIGITGLFHPSLCLLHYQFNRTLSAADCDCRHPRHHVNDRGATPLGHWVETRSKKRAVADLSPEVVDLIDAHTTVDSRLFAAALRLVLGRLRRVEELTGAAILECVDWHTLMAETEHIQGLWTNGPGSLLPS